MSKLSEGQRCMKVTGGLKVKVKVLYVTIIIRQCPKKVLCVNVNITSRDKKKH